MSTRWQKKAGAAPLQKKRGRSSPALSAGAFQIPVEKFHPLFLLKLPKKKKNKSLCITILAYPRRFPSLKAQNPRCHPGRPPGSRPGRRPQRGGFGGPCTGPGTAESRKGTILRPHRIDFSRALRVLGWKRSRTECRIQDWGWRRERSRKGIYLSGLSRNLTVRCTETMLATKHSTIEVNRRIRKTPSTSSSKIWNRSV